MPTTFNNISITNIENLIFGDQWSLMREVSNIVITQGYYTMSSARSLAPKLGGFMNSDENYYWDTKFFYSRLENILVQAEDFIFEKRLELPVNYNSVLEDGEYGINIVFNSNICNSYRSLLNCSDLIKRNNDGTFSFYTIDRSIYNEGDECLVAKIIVDGYSINEGTLEEVLNRENVDYINIFDNYLTDIFFTDNNLSLKLNDIPLGKTLFLASNYSASEKTYNDEHNASSVKDLNKMLSINKQLVVKLGTNLDIYGSLINGGVLNQSGTGVQGLISGDYATLDLNGNTLTIKDGGYLESYGNIIDSKGGGKIIVEDGGKILTPFVVTDFNGGTVIVGRYNSNMSPFNSYMMPYLGVETKIEYGGKLLGNCVLYAGGNHNETQIEFVGNSSDSLIQLNNENSKIRLTKEGSLEDLSSYYEVIDFNGDITINSMNIELLIYNISTNKVPFPISQYLSLNINSGSTLHVNQLLKVMNGAKINASNGSKIIFEDSKSSNSLQSGLFIYSSFNKNSIKYNNKSDVEKAYGNIFGLSYYEEVRDSSFISIEGEVEFKGNNHIFSGKFDKLSNFDTNIKANLDKLDISSYALYEGGDYQSNILTDDVFNVKWLKGGYNYIDGSSAANYYTTPLIVNDKAYIKDNNGNLIEGSFDLNKGLFTSDLDNKEYIFIFDNNDYKFGKSMYNNNSETVFEYNAKGKYVAIDEAKTNSIYSVNGKDYVYFMGAFVEGNINGSNFIFKNNKFKYNPLQLDLVEEVTLSYKDNKWNQ